MGSKKLNNVLNLLIEEIKSKEKVINNKESKSSKRKGADIARSLLNEDSNISNRFLFSKKEGKKNYIDKNSSKNGSEGNNLGIEFNHKREELEDPLKKNDENKFNHKENERRRITSSSNNSSNISSNISSSSKNNNDIDQEEKEREKEKKEKEKENEQHEDEDEDKNENENENVDDEKDEEEDEEENCSLSESEKQVLHFYDPTIDDYDEEYVTRKYRFMATDCDSSLCCCGCFTPVCYKSERHPTYVNQYKSLYAVSVAIEKERILKAKEINMKKVTQQINDTSSSNSNSDESAFSETESDEENKEKEEKEDKEEEEEEKEEKGKGKGKEVFYKHLNQANAAEATVQTKNKKRKKKKKKRKKTKYTYYPVFCVNCNNHLAYYEIETKLFHFFDVLPD